MSLIMNERIIIDSNICHGKPVIKGTRVLVSNIIADLAEGLSNTEVINNYPNITSEDIQAALEFCSVLANFETEKVNATA